MVSPMGLSSHISKTYGKRSGVKRKQTNDSTDRRDINDVPATAKRRRRSPDLETTPSPAETDAVSKDSTPPRPSPKTVYGTPCQTASTPVVQHSPSKPARDLSLIFEDILPVNNTLPSPSKLAKRMLSRSKTESSVEGQSSLQETKVERTPSLPNLSSPSKTEEPAASTSKSISAILPLVTPSSNAPVTRTYAGKFRSFLVSFPATSTAHDPLSTVIDADDLDARESYSSLRNRWGVDNSEDDPYHYASPSPSKSLKSDLSTPDTSPSRHGKRKGKAVSSFQNHSISMPDLMNLKSISELRNKGENRRFFDEVGYLFEGMDKTGGIGLRRASALEITTKLCDPDFTRKAKAADFFTKTWDVFCGAGAGQGGDKLLDTILAFFVTLVARDPSLLADLAQHVSSAPFPSQLAPKQHRVESSSFVGVLLHLLERSCSDCDPLRLVMPNSTTEDSDYKKAGIMKKDHSTLASVYKTIIKSDLFSAETMISTSLLISYTLSNLPPALISTAFFPSFLASFRATLAYGTSTSLMSALSLHWKDVAESISYETIYYHLQLLDTYLLDQWGNSVPEGSQPEDGQRQPHEAIMEEARDTWLAEDLISLAICVELEGTNGPEFAQGCLDITLRILVSLTHADELWARRVLNCEYTMGWLLRLIHKCGQDLQHNQQQVKVEDGVKSEEENHLLSDNLSDSATSSSALDTLCLALGLLTNLVQVVKEARQIVSDIRLNPSCTLQKRACIRKCVCSRSVSGVEVLAHLYSSFQIKPEALPTSLDEESPEARAEADASFLRGHLSVLFGLLMKENSENQSKILAALPTPTLTTSKNVNMVKRAKMSRLVEQAKDFAAFYTAVSSKLGSDTNNSTVKEVVAFLAKTRDSYA
ncbi:hypothetical protein JR316_0007911 [Psilocybe cubensis]|uniref:Wings apart-like protein C-terminal domain-containing protein n=2 Tax=Psilocybe cubensis TaxID=181762 RepID=A0A8H7XVD0_PSICU|nr:hypothetical protein JR316_0007911 [Psilocybe cubensis]KAH9479321.1 hypothetical protein JR316_0007911 [Psilocybe cubensis]